MKKAFEIANVAAVSTTRELRSRSVFPSLRPQLFPYTQVCFFGEQYPHFVFIDDIQFVRVSELLCVAVRIVPILLHARSDSDLNLSLSYLITTPISR